MGITLKKFRDLARLPREVRRWTQAAAATRAGQEAMNAEGWPPDVHQGYALKDGLSPADFRRPWGLSNVHLRHIRIGEHYPDDIALVYGGNLPPETPQASHNPSGMALANVEFELRDHASGEVLDTDLRDHYNGEVTGFLGEGARLWSVLKPGGSIRVRLAARPKFFYLTADGAAMLAYNVGGRGYFSGKTVFSPVYTLSMTEDGAVLIDGAARPSEPEPEIPLPNILTADYLGGFLRDKAEYLGKTFDSIIGETQLGRDYILALSGGHGRLNPESLPLLSAVLEVQEEPLEALARRSGQWEDESLEMLQRRLAQENSEAVSGGAVGGASGEASGGADSGSMASGGEVLPELVPYDEDRHCILRQIAHKCLLRPDEFEGFLAAVREAVGPERIVNATLPEWPPVPYAPLALIMSVQVGGGGGKSKGPWWEDCFWTGAQPVLIDDGHIEAVIDGENVWAAPRTIARRIGRKLRGSEYSAERAAYMWQVPEFDPSEHVIIRDWIEERQEDVPAFWLDFWPQHRVEGAVVKVTNPHLAEEAASGSFTYTRRAMRRDHLHLLRSFLIFRGREAGEEPEPAPPPEPPPPPPPKPEPEPSRVPTFIPPSPVMKQEDDSGRDVPLGSELARGSKIYELREVVAAMENTFGKRPRFFSGRPMDSAIVAMTRENIDKFLKADRTDRARYVRDAGGRNTDCEDFGLRLRTQLQWSTGINGVGVIAGDTHGWSIFLVAEEDEEPGILMIEPQTDAVVPSATGEYAIERRFEIIL